MISCDSLRRGLSPVVAVFALLLSPVAAQGPIYPGPSSTGRYQPSAPNRYAPAPAPGRYAAPGSVGRAAPAPNRYNPPAPGGYNPAGRGPRAPQRVAHQPRRPAPAGVQLRTARPGEHPLMPAIDLARAGLARIEQVPGYSAVLVKRELIGEELSDTEYMFVKKRQQPFSVYMYLLGSEELKGQEVIYVEGENDGNMWAHSTGLESMFGTVSIAPNSWIAMRGQRYPTTEIGILTLTRRLIELAGKDAQYGECKVNVYRGAKINNRLCTCIEVIHPVPRRNFHFHLARIFVDDELVVPVRYVAYGWPKKPGDPPVLMEEYTYLNLNLNCRFTDADFDPKNPNYRFP